MRLPRSLAAYGASRRSRVAALATAVAAVAVISGCGSADPQQDKSTPGNAQFKPVEQDKNSAITVWVDATREAAVKAYQAAHPEAKIKMVTYSGGANGANDLQTKVQLFDRTGEGWPDVVWPGIQDPSWAASGAKPFAAPISDLFSKEELSGYADNAMDLCTFGGKVYCVRNDLAQVVTWYNKKLMDKFGYKVPTTWEEYEALGLKVAKEHPGYLVGEIGSVTTPDIFLRASQCPMSAVTDGKKLTVDLHDPKCTRMTTLLDKLLNAGVLGKVNKYDTGFIKSSADKMLLMPGPSWYGKTLFDATYKTPAGEIAAAPPLKFEADSQTYTGAGGGGMWFISSHSKNLEASKDFVKWVTQDPTFTASAGTYPAYKAAAAGWLKEQQKSGYFANDIGPALTTAAEEIWPGWAQSTAFSHQAIYGSTVLPQITAGKTITSQLDTWQQEIENKAKSLGYTVN
jgi:multiple sugar transport system substrate-binding protein